MDTVERIRQMSLQDFAALGLNDIAYVKPVLIEGEPAFAVHAADGTEMIVLPKHEVAVAAVRQHELEPMSVH
jgi:hypothetical protein